MRKWLLLVLALSLLFGTTACHGGDVDPQKLVSQWDRFVEMCGRTQITPDSKLIGTRTYGEDDYVGTYYADCDEENGRDVIFGGGSVQERDVHLQGHVEQTSGTVQLRVRLGEQVEEPVLDAQGNFDLSYHLDGGGNYFMLDYEGFSGTITLSAFYIQNDAAV